MRILVACEESQAVTKELRRLGHEAYSCDLIPESGGALRVAYTSGRQAAPQNEMGHDYCPSSVHIPDSLLSYQAVQPRPYHQGQRPGREGLGSGKLFLFISECRLPAHCHREPRTAKALQSTGLHPDHRAVHVRRSVEETHMFMAQGPAAASTDKHSRTEGTLGGQHERPTWRDRESEELIHSQIKSRSEDSEQDFSGHRASNGGTVGGCSQ